MSTFHAILTPSPDGTLHLPLPVAWRNHSIKVTAELEVISSEVAQEQTFQDKPQAPRPGSLKGFKMAPDFDKT